MIPQYDTDLRVDVDLSRVRTPTAFEVVDGFTINREYEPLVDVSWAEARDCLLAESRWLQRASEAASASEFDEILEGAPEQEGAVDDFDWLFRYLDVGVAGLVLVLAAAGCATCYSCRGHAPELDRVPQVRLTCGRERLQLLIELARSAGCGVEVDDEGLVNLYATSVDRLNRLAQAVLNDREAFEALPAEPWRPRALAALEQGEEFEWDDDEV